MEIIAPAWPAPANIVAGVTTRDGGQSAGPYASLNLALHVGDDADAVEKNREELISAVNQRATQQKMQPLKRWCWLEQTHSSIAIDANSITDQLLQADASYSVEPGTACVVLTADCLPILLADRKGRAVAAIHAGWRGLCDGVIGSCIQQLCQATLPQGGRVQPIELLAWLGPAIGPDKFEVGEDVYQGFANAAFANTQNRAAIADAFLGENSNGRYRCDLYQLACVALHGSGVKQIYGGGFCTASQPEQFYSYRRDGNTGRMASFVALTNPPDHK